MITERIPTKKILFVKPEVSLKEDEGGNMSQSSRGTANKNLFPKAQIQSG